MARCESKQIEAVAKGGGWVNSFSTHVSGEIKTRHVSLILEPNSNGWLLDSIVMIDSSIKNTLFAIPEHQRHGPLHAIVKAECVDALQTRGGSGRGSG